MPFQPTESLLNLKSEKMHTIDTRSVEDLHGLWLVFHKASKVLEDGPRLENMSWRLWNRETFCCSQPLTARPNHKCSGRQMLSRRKSLSRVPELASSVDTVSSNEDDLEDIPSDSPSANVVRPELTRLDSHDMRTQKHISSVDFEKIVVSIKQTREIEPIDDLQIPALCSALDNSLKIEPDMAPSDAQVSSIPEPITAQPTVEVSDIDHDDLPFVVLTTESSALTTTTSNTSDASHDDAGTSDSSSTAMSSTAAMSTHDVVRGFVPGGAPSSYRSQTTLATQPAPILKNSYRPMPTPARRKGAEFTLGGSSAEDESSLESHTYKNSVSSLAERMHKKQASFRDDNLVSKIQDSPVFESDDEDEDDEVSEDVIDDEDEDSSSWEDEMGDDDDSEDEAPVFHRVDSRPNLKSHRSLLTSMMHQGDRAAALQNAASRSVPAIRRTQTTPPQGSSRAVSPVARERNGPDGQGSSALPIAMVSKQYAHLALSPRTTRRNMLQSELTESLRKHLLWERQHKNTNNAALKRRHTSHDIKNLKQHPDPVNMSRGETAAQFSNDYFHAGLGEYHTKGW